MKKHEAKKKLLDSKAMSDELFKLMISGQTILLSLLERHIDGESFDIENEIAANALKRMTEMQNEPQRHLVLNKIILDSLTDAIPKLIVANNEELLKYCVSHASEAKPTRHRKPLPGDPKKGT